MPLDISTNNDIAAHKRAIKHSAEKTALEATGRLASNDTGKTVSNGWRNWGAFQLNRFTFSANYGKDNFRVSE